ncbi:hypothetical protein BDN72DRAFT_861195 [Pluteus cervinus]|uniref:Uncharacterized protein n=1 Tax=Pluteus cervinus TaxID=181527 RepID=A0ACD3AHC8_9AGAR|nr:hypothetical protein BDN72DRAFT_861195 [Pluteus cervinus]
MPPPVFSLVERNLLENQLPAWKAAKEQGGSGTAVSAQRRQIVDALFGVLRRQRRLSTLAQKNSLWNSIRLWLANHGRRESLLTRKRWATHWSPRSVIIEVKRQQIAEYISAKSTMIPGSEGYLADYQRREMAVARDLAKKWNEERPPLAVQVRNARKAHRAIFRFLRELHIQYGMVAVLLSARSDGEQVITGTYDFGKNFWKRSLTAEYPKWDDEAMGCLEKFGRSVFGNWFGAVLFSILTLDRFPESEGVQEPTEPQRKSDIPIGPNGHPRLPPRRPLKLKELRLLLREFLTACYRLFTGDDLAHVPWEALEKEIENYVDAIYLPPQERLVSPMKMHQRTVGIFFNFLYKRQEELKCPIVFAFKAYKLGKGPKAGCVDVPTSIEDGSGDAAGQDDVDQDEEPETPQPTMIGTRIRGCRSNNTRAKESHPGPSRNSTGEDGSGNAAGQDDVDQAEEPASPQPTMIGTRTRGRWSNNTTAKESHPGPSRNSTGEDAPGNAVGRDDVDQDEEPETPQPIMIGTRTRRRGSNDTRANKGRPGPSKNSTGFLGSRSPSPADELPQAKSAKPSENQVSQKRVIKPRLNADGSQPKYTPVRVAQEASADHHN